MEYITARHLQQQFKLPPILAAEIDAEQTCHALRHRWQPWAWLACWLLLRRLFHSGAFIAPMTVALTSWISLARWLAGPAMLTAAEAKARRLGIPVEEAPVRRCPCPRLSEFLDQLRPLSPPRRNQRGVPV